MSGKQLDKDLIDHACDRLAKIARQKVREGLGPESAARAAIRETKALFPHDWDLSVQGGDDEEAVEVWEVEHKLAIPCARITREPVLERAPKLTANQLEVLDQLHKYQRRSSRSFTPTLQRALPKLVKLGLIDQVYGDQYQMTGEGVMAHRALRGEDEQEDEW